MRLSHTHRFRHTKLTRLAELGLPVHVLQRYAGHATPTMTMHYIAQREEHAELAFLATAKLRADGTRVAVLPRGPRQPAPVRPGRPVPAPRLVPAATAADLRQGQRLPDLLGVRHRRHPPTPPWQRQLRETEELIARTTAEFQQRHGRPMPEDNVWLAQRRAEHARPDPGSWPPWPTTPAARSRAAAAARPPTAGPVPLTLEPRAPPKEPTMTDPRAKRIAVLTAAAKAKSETKTRAAEQGHPCPGQARRADHLPSRPT